MVEMVRCNSDDRCEPCPIRLLKKAHDKAAAGELVRAAFREARIDVENAGKSWEDVEAGTLLYVIDEHAQEMGVQELKPFAVGATVLQLTKLCKVGQSD